MPGQTNAERTVRCPVEGCGAEKLSRGINLHIRQSKGDGHGPQGEIPEGIDFDNLQTVGTREVSMDYPETRKTEKIGRLCPYCKEGFQGKEGVMIHLGRSAGKGPHPEDPKKNVDSENLSIASIDADRTRAENITHSKQNETGVEKIEKSAATPSKNQRQEHEGDVHLKQEVRNLIEEFRNEGKDEAADRLEEVLSSSE